MVTTPRASPETTVRVKTTIAAPLASPDAGHMVGLTVAWKDSNHITDAWTWREKGKPDHTELFQFTRKK